MTQPVCFLPCGFLNFFFLQTHQGLEIAVLTLGINTVFFHYRILSHVCDLMNNKSFYQSRKDLQHNWMQAENKAQSMTFVMVSAVSCRNEGFISKQLASLQRSVMLCQCARAKHMTFLLQSKLSSELSFYPPRASGFIWCVRSLVKKPKKIVSK